MLKFFLPPCVQRTISQCNIIVYFSSSHWAATASPTGRDELFTSCLLPRHCHHLALCNENRPWAPQAEIHKLLQECRDTCTLPCPWVICARNRKAWLHCTVCSYVALQLSHKRVGAALCQGALCWWKQRAGSSGAELLDEAALLLSLHSGHSCALSLAGLSQPLLQYC